MSENSVTLPNIAEMAADERPREKALSKGMGALSDVELMAIIFGTGTHGMPVMAMCAHILDDLQGHLSLLAEMPAKDVVHRYHGIGMAKALNLLAGLELGRRAAKDAATRPDAQITSSQLAYDYMRDKLEGLDHEEFWVLYLTPSCRPLHAGFIAKGGISSTYVDVKVIMRQALLAQASRMILFHNHPSGNLKASPQDIALTQRIRESARMFEIRVDDHIIITPRAFYSFSDNGL